MLLLEGFYSDGNRFVGAVKGGTGFNVSRISLRSYCTLETSALISLRVL